MNSDNGETTDLAVIVVTVVPLAVLVIRHFVPSFKMDNYTIYLILIAMAPWLATWIRTVEFAGVGKVDFNGIHDAAKQDGLIDDGDKEDYLSKAKSLINIGPETKNELVKTLVGIMKQSETMVKEKGMDPPKDFIQTIDMLSKKEVIDDNQKRLLLGVADIYSRVLKGKSIDSRIAEFAIKIGPRLLEKLK